MIKIIKYLFYLFAAASFFCSCSPQARLRHLIDKHPELVKRDTITVSDTLIVPAVRTDTVIKATNFCAGRDTIIIEKERLLIKQFVRNDSIFINAECRGDTIVQDLLVPVDRVIYINKTNNILYLWIALLAALSIYLLTKYLQKWEQSLKKPQ